MKKKILSIVLFLGVLAPAASLLGSEQPGRPICPSPLKVFDPATGQCVCGGGITPVTCTAPDFIDPNTCQCRRSR